MGGCHVAGGGAFDEFGGFGGAEILAEVFVNFDFDGFHLLGGGVCRGWQVDFEGDFLGGSVHFFNLSREFHPAFENR